jgi:hypothetical protein
MPARNSVRGRKGENPPEKLPASKVPSRATPPLEMMTTPAVIPSTPVTRSTTLAKKNRPKQTPCMSPPNLAGLSSEEIATLCPSLSIVKAWRIVSRKTNRPTSFIRVLTTDKLTVDYMLINGIDLYGRTFVCDTSHPPTSSPLQCPRCPLAPLTTAPTLHGRARARVSNRS